MFTKSLTHLLSKGGNFPSPWMWARLSELLLMNRMWQKWCYVVSKARTWKTIASAWLSLSWITCLGGSQLPCHENTGASLGEVYEEKTAPQNQVTCVSHLKRASSSPIKASDNCSLSYNNILTLASWETPSQNYPAKLLQNSWPTETARDNKCLLLF